MRGKKNNMSVDGGFTRKEAEKIFTNMMNEKILPILTEIELCRIFIKSLKGVINSDDNEVEKLGFTKLQYISFLISEFEK